MANLKPRLTIDNLVKGVLEGNRIVLGQAITLTESMLPSDQKLAHQLLERIVSRTGNSFRIGITGVPGVGKSTFIESFGQYVTSLGKKIAVLAVDPSSRLTKGSILGDKTRMEKLVKNPSVFIRPSASGEALGGVAFKTREAILLCEAAGYDVILIETVGVGQSEVAVKNMVDFFLLLMLAGAGDELQGIKKGIMEIADMVVITKDDGDSHKQVMQAKTMYINVMHLLAPSPSGWEPTVSTCSALEGLGIAEIWKTIVAFKDYTTGTGFFERNRHQQAVSWLHEYFEQLIKTEIKHRLKTKITELEDQVMSQQLSPPLAAHRLLEAYHKSFSAK